MISLLTSLISTVEADPFYGRENDDAIGHLTKLTELGGLFTTDERIRNFYVTKLLPFSLKGDARAWYDALPCGSFNVQKDLLANNAKQDNLQAYGIKTRGGTHTQDPVYPEGHPKRIEQDSQVQEEEIVISPKNKKKKKHKEANNSNDPIEEEEHAVDPNSIFTSDAETEDGAEPENDAEKNDPPEV